MILHPHKHHLCPDAIYRCNNSFIKGAFTDIYKFNVSITCIAVNCLSIIVFIYPKIDPRLNKEPATQDKRKKRPVYQQAAKKFYLITIEIIDVQVNLNNKSSISIIVLSNYTYLIFIQPVIYLQHICQHLRACH